ncbi:nitrilase-related carbon-nitrogen hydrolase [Aquamicrobium terrae]|uniref:Amidohydrolase n=1 Tax=Aquamicrobium terrae TaxID=1324945 RepID=A0ABV2N2B6_9HYPH
MSSLTVAAVQFSPLLGDLGGNRARTLGLIDRAAAQGAKLVVLPECSTSGYAFSDRSEIEGLAEGVPGETIEAWHERAQHHGIVIVGGLIERTDDVFYNSSVVVTQAGLAGVYRKVHLWGKERELYRPGDAISVVDTPIGHIGTIICYDLWFPELSRSLALSGADILVSPANWAGNARLSNPYDRYGLPVGYHMAVATAAVNERPVIVADRIGVENGLRFLGSSCIVRHSGEVVAGPGQHDGEQILVADIDIGPREEAVQSNPQSRRPDVYRNLGEQ